MAAVFLAPVYLLCNAYIIYWMIKWLNVTVPVLGRGAGLVAVLVVYVFFMVSLLTSFLMTKHPSRRCLKKISDQWLGSFAYILGITVLLDLLHRLLLLTPLAGTWLYSGNGMVFAGTAGAVGMILVIVYGIRHADKIVLTRYQIRIHKAYRSEKQQNLRIVLLADLHLGSSVGKKQVSRIVSMVNQCRPDLIVIAGDLFDNDFSSIEDPEETASLLAEMESRLGTWACWGNHDINEKILAGFTFSVPGGVCVDPRFDEFLRQAKIHMMNDDCCLMDDSFYLIGRKDPQRIEKTGETRMEPEELLKQTDESLPVIVIDHQPKQLRELAQAGVDLDLSGHTHNGQVFPGNLFLRLMWKNPCGVKKIGTMYSVVTSGAGYWGPGLRVGTDKEVVLIETSFTNTSKSQIKTGFSGEGK